jgi:Transport and Golgi organisation 2
MCTAILSVEPGAPVLLAGIRDEFTGRAWEPPARHWPEYPGLIGGRDLVAGGTWLAVAPAAHRVSCVLNGRGRPAPADGRRSRGVLPLQAAAEGKLVRDDLAAFDPFLLISAEPGAAVLWGWDGDTLIERDLPPGLHLVVNSGLAADLQGAVTPADVAAPGREHELARIARFLPRLRAAARPDPRPGLPVAQAWGDWFPLVNGDGLGPGDPQALIVRRQVGDRVWGTTSVSLVALSPGDVRYDFNGSPGDPSAWQPVPLAQPG